MEDKSLKGKCTDVVVIGKAKDISYFKGQVTLPLIFGKLYCKFIFQNLR